MGNEQIQTVPPRLDGHSHQPGFGLYDSRCKVELPPGIQIGSFAWGEWRRSLPPESFETILPQSMAGLLEWLREHRDTVLILMNVRRRVRPDVDENATHPDAFKQAAAVVVDGISWLNHFAGEVVIEPRCLTKPDANAIGGLEDLIEVVRQRLVVKPDANAGWPTLSPDELRKLFDIKQDALVKRLKSQAIRNKQITTKAYLVDPTALPDNWKRTLNRE